MNVQSATVGRGDLNERVLVTSLRSGEQALLAAIAAQRSHDGQAGGIGRGPPSCVHGDGV